MNFFCSNNICIYQVYQTLVWKEAEFFLIKSHHLKNILIFFFHEKETKPSEDVGLSKGWVVFFLEYSLGYMGKMVEQQKIILIAYHFKR